MEIAKLRVQTVDSEHWVKNVRSNIGVACMTFGSYAISKGHPTRVFRVLDLRDLRFVFYIN